MTGRMVTQKGLDLILQSSDLLAMDAQFVFLGSGEQKYETALVELASSAPDRFGVQLDFTDRLEHRLMAGADLFLMPSLYEPCGLTQMRAQRYGSPPIVRHVGGLADTVDDALTRFCFRSVHPGSLSGGHVPGAGHLPASVEVASRHAAGDGPRLQLGAFGRDLSGRLPPGGGPVRRGPVSARSMDFVFTLHSHLPYVLNHGRWPHGSDWLCEAALDTYLPLLEVFRGLASDAVPAPVTIGFTPVLANQLTNPTFVTEMEAFFDQRIKACDEAPASLATTGETHLLPLVGFWRDRLVRLRQLFHDIDRDLIGAFRALEAAGRIEIIGSAATHGYLPLLARDESIRLQLAVGVSEHRRIFGRSPTGCWLAGVRLSAAGPLGALAHGSPHRDPAGHRGAPGRCRASSSSSSTPIWRQRAGPSVSPAIRRAIPRSTRPRAPPIPAEPLRSPYRAYRVAHGPVAAYVRDPRASMQVWSRFEGYPGDESVSRVPQDALARRAQALARDRPRRRPRRQAAVRSQGGVASGRGDTPSILPTYWPGSPPSQAQNREGVVVAPFDTELFGHWWFEGPEFLGDVYRSLARQPRRDSSHHRLPTSRRSTRPARRSGCPGVPGAPTATAACG